MPESFGAHVLNLSRLKDLLPPVTWRSLRRTVEERREFDPAVADAVACEIQKWASSLGVTHYTHWFSPLTGLTAGKQNSFLDYEIPGQVLCRFSGKDLVKGEPDASSFPNGGMRSTFEARGYTAWDPTSPVFVILREQRGVLYIPSVFFGLNGEVLDKKTPLLRSLRRVHETAADLVSLFRSRPLRIRNMVGPEQEFFLVDESHYRERPDLAAVGRVLFAARPPRGQQMGDHYFGRIPERVMAFLEEVEQVCTRLGIPLKTRHNEVAPNQFEIAPLYEEANIAVDHNQILMDLLQETARRHGMACLLHEKPFACFNGSGKHLNWSLMDEKGRNLLAPNGNRSSRLVFLSVLAGFIAGLHQYEDLLQAVLASPGNELRLGGHEAPPAIVSAYLGEEIQSILQNPEEFVTQPRRGHRTIRVESGIPRIHHDLSDRNRTSPVAFTGNKFEIRMPGASANLAFPLAMVNTMAAEGFIQVTQALKGITDPRLMARALAEVIQSHAAVIHEGDNYTRAWADESRRRGLTVPDSVPHTVSMLGNEKNVGLLERHGILTGNEARARVMVKTELYAKTVEMELRVARFLLRAHVIPAALKNQQILLNAVRDFPAPLLENDGKLLDPQLRFIHKFTAKINRAMKLLSRLDDDNETLKALDDPFAKARLCAGEIRPHLAETGMVAEKIEERVERSCWSIPKIMDLLFR
ncbi:MAG: glutamine synthetase III [Acidobacteriota bacterium]|jgi:glutamine synthetase|nr:glutamine synthetase III [Acidobacteriota bacterium]